MENVKPSRLSDLSREELLSEVVRLRAHVNQLKNLLNKKNGHKECSKKSKNRQFDFTKVNFRHVLLKFCYLGWDHDGYATQEDTSNTIEDVIFNALIKTKLIRDRQSSNYHRCGRTDKGVSAFSQVISIDLRSSLSKEEIDEGKFDGELPYLHMLNRVMAPEVRMLSWSCAPTSSFSARFDCKMRTYKYFFPRGNLNLKLMSEACSLLIGEHDFRNICKMDVANGVTNYQRCISAVDISPFCLDNDTNINNKKLHDNNDEEIDDNTNKKCYQMYTLTIKGTAFLWHQVRCIAALLIMIGQEKEEPQIISDLLDTKKHPCRPQYPMASEIPLVLYHCEYEGVRWTTDEDDMKETLQVLQKLWCKYQVKSTVIRSMLEDLGDIGAWGGTCSLLGDNNKVHKPLKLRPTCESLSDRIEYHKNRKKIKMCVNDDDSLKKNLSNINNNDDIK